MSSLKKCWFPECEFKASQSQSLLFHIIEEHRMKPADSSPLTFDEKNFVPASKREVEENRNAHIVCEAARRAAIIVHSSGGEVLPPDGLKRDSLPHVGAPFHGLIENQSTPALPVIINEIFESLQRIQSLEKEVGKMSDSEKTDKHRNELLNPAMGGQTSGHKDGRQWNNDRYFSTNNRDSTSPTYHRRRSDNNPHYYPRSTYRGRPYIRRSCQGQWINRDGGRLYIDYNMRNTSPERVRTSSSSQHKRSDKSPERKLDEAHAGNVISTSHEALKALVGTVNKSTLFPPGIRDSNKTIDCEGVNPILSIITPQVERSCNLTRMEPTSKRLGEVIVTHLRNYVIPKRKESLEGNNQSKMMRHSIKPNEDITRGNGEKRKNVDDYRQDRAKVSKCRDKKLGSQENNSQTQGVTTTNNKASTSIRHQMEEFPYESLNKRSRKFETDVHDSFKLNNQTKITDAQKHDSKLIQRLSITDTLRVSSLDERIENMLKGDDRHDTKKKEIEGDVRQNSKEMKIIELNTAICPSTVPSSVSNAVTLYVPATSVSSVESRNDPVATEPLEIKQTWTLRYSGVVEMLEVLTNFPLPWLESKLFPVVRKCMGQYHTTHLSNTLQIICKTSKVAQDIISSMPPGTPKTPKTPQTEPSPAFPSKNNVEDIPTRGTSQESLNSKVLSAMLDIMKSFPLPWNQKRLNPVMLRSMGKHSGELVTNTLQIICKTCNDVLRMMADQSETDDESTINNKQ